MFGVFLAKQTTVSVLTSTKLQGSSRCRPAVETGRFIPACPATVAVTTSTPSPSLHPGCSRRHDADAKGIHPKFQPRGNTSDDAAEAGGDCCSRLPSTVRECRCATAGRHCGLVVSIVRCNRCVQSGYPWRVSCGVDSSRRCVKVSSHSSQTFLSLVNRRSLRICARATPHASPVRMHENTALQQCYSPPLSRRWCRHGRVAWSCRPHDSCSPMLRSMVSRDADAGQRQSRRARGRN